jgi:hypothetical protein
MRTEHVRFFRAVGQIAAGSSIEDEEERPFSADAPDEDLDGTPRVALLDGVPLAQHEALAGRLVVDDPDGLEELAPAARRVHGTAMASVVVRGDLNGSSEPHTRPLYVRPILSAQAPDWVRDPREELPRDRLPVDLVHEAVTRLYEGEAVAPDVRAIVLAVGDEVAQFDRFVSPLARLLDWLSFRHGVAFLVSAGNHLADLEFAADAALDDANELQHEALCALHRTSALRRLLSPAESVNAVTIGAAHDDSSSRPASDDRIDPIIVAAL